MRSIAANCQVCKERVRLVVARGPEAALRPADPPPLVCVTGAGPWYCFADHALPWRSCHVAPLFAGASASWLLAPAGAPPAGRHATDRRATRRAPGALGRLA